MANLIIGQNNYFSNGQLVTAQCCQLTCHPHLTHYIVTKKKPRTTQKAAQSNLGEFIIIIRSWSVSWNLRALHVSSLYEIQNSGFDLFSTQHHKEFIMSHLLPFPTQSRNFPQIVDILRVDFHWWNYCDLENVRYLMTFKVFSSVFSKVQIANSSSV